jgi:hypothetical protein
LRFDARVPGWATSFMEDVIKLEQAKSRICLDEILADEIGCWNAANRRMPH